MIVPQGLVIGPAGLEPPVGARKRRKATVKNTKNRPLRCDVMKWTIPVVAVLQMYMVVLVGVMGQ